jgi:predicted nucleotidyltransferase
MVDESVIHRAAELLGQAAPGSTVILFGSYARGKPKDESDVDFLVVEPQVSSQVDEMVRLRRVLSPLRIPVDVLVVSREHFDHWRDTPGNVMYEAAVEGKVVYEAA